MFTGIVEAVGTVLEVKDEGTNRTLRVAATLDEPIKVDQSISHNGTCLTVTEIAQNNETGEKQYAVVAVQETLEKTNLGALKAGDLLNIERCLKVGQRLDGHFVQGHVDTVGHVQSVETRDGSWMIRFTYPKEKANLIVPKGSICVNGVSLTVVDPEPGAFSVTIIPYTFEHTNFKTLQAGDAVNLEFDILGKYLLNIYG